MNTSNRLYLYSVHAPVPFVDGDRPPLCVERLTKRNLEGTAVLAALAFSAPNPPRLCWNESGSWLELPLALIPTMFVDEQDFLDAIPSIQQWLYEWSGSADRAPVLTPEWATTRDVSPEAVKRFAQGLETHLATTTTIRIEFCNSDGKPFLLKIPAKAALALPPPMPDDSVELQVASKELAHKYALPSGREIVILMDEKSDEIEIGSEPLHADPRRIRSKPVIHVKRMRALSVDRARG